MIGNQIIAHTPLLGFLYAIDKGANFFVIFLWYLFVFLVLLLD